MRASRDSLFFGISHPEVILNSTQQSAVKPVNDENKLFWIINYENLAFNE